MTSHPALRQHQVTRTLRAVDSEIGATDRDRLATLLEHVGDDGRIRLSEALAGLFPEFAIEDALTRFRQLRSRLKQAADAAGVDLELVVDTDKRSPPEERWCWFEGESRAVAQVERYSREEAQGAQPAEAISQRALLQLEARDGKPVIRYFVSYAHADSKYKEDLLRRLKTRFSCSADFVFEGWQDGDILAGDRWQIEIERAIERCHFGLLLVSYDFLSSDVITREELPRFLPKDEGSVGWRRGVPVGLKPVPFDGSVDLKGLQEIQVFRQDGRFYSQRRVDHTRDAFVEELFQQILALAHKHVSSPASAPLWQPGGAREPLVRPRFRGSKGGEAAKIGHSLLLAEEQRLYLEESGEAHPRIVPTEGTPTRLSKDPEASGAGERVDALDYLEDWVRRPGAPPFCALLGDYGLGKTTTCKALTLRLLDAREDDPSLPLPIYLDLRHLGEAAKSGPALSEILDTVLRKSWRAGGEADGLEAREIVRLVQEEGALAIFDGLDEVLVHLSLAGGQQFTRELWRILPPSVLQRSLAGKGRAEVEAEAGDDGRAGRLLISCRTHFFRTLREQATHLTGEDREGISASDYQALILLPFTEAQVREYLRRNMPGQDLDHLLDLIRSIHNLPELAERPYTLSLIAGQIPQLERWKMEGRKVLGVTLYRGMVQSWLERDTGKHQLTPDHKQRLMEHLAAALWRSGKRSWSVEDLEQWLIDFLEANPGFAAHYHGKDRSLLKEDLRTATFLVREGEGDFRFAHTSLQEFFLAAWLHRALIEGRPEDWEMAVPSRETLHFLGQLLEEEGTEPGLKGLRELRDSYRPLASELAFAYGLHAVKHQLPAQSLVGIRLPGANLRGWHIEGRSNGPLLNLREGDFEGARLDGARFVHVNLTGANLGEAGLLKAELLEGQAVRADFRGAVMDGCRLRRMDLEAADFDAAALYRTQFLSCQLAGAKGLDDRTHLLLADCEPRQTFPSICPAATAPNSVVPTTGHDGLVFSGAYSPEGDRVVSCGSDGTVRLWDARSGDPLLTLSGHDGWVFSSAISPEGDRVVSSGSDGTVRVWDSASGDPLLTLEGHGGGVNSSAFSSDGGRVVSSGDDGTVRVWDSASGDPLLTLEGHGDVVWSSAFSPEGGRVVSSGSDGTVRLWDAVSGAQLLKLEGHSGGVASSAFSPEGGRVVSCGFDGTVRLWDAASGDRLLTLEGHVGHVTFSAFSPEGGRVVSCGIDGTVRVWDAVTGDPLVKISGHSGGVLSSAFSPEGNRVVSWGSDGTVRVWDAASGDLLLTLGGSGGVVFSSGFSPDGGRVVSSGSDGAVRVWDAASGKPLRTLEGHEGWVYSSSFSPDGGRVVSSGFYGTLRIWDAASGDLLLALEGHRGGVISSGFSPDGGRLVSSGYEGTVRVWDAASGAPLLTLEGHRGWVSSSGFSPDGGRVVSSGDDGMVRLWDAASGDPLLTLEGHRGGVRSSDFSPDGGRVVSSGDDGMVRVWDSASGEPLLTLEGHRGTVWSSAFSSDGGRVVSSGDDGRVRVWDAASGHPLVTLEGHRGVVYSSAFSPDGGRVVSSGSDGTVRVWDAHSGEPVAFLAHHLPDYEFAVLSPDASEIRWATPGAWRWLGWSAPDRETGAMMVYPAEIFGPLPPPPDTLLNR